MISRRILLAASAAALAAPKLRAQPAKVLRFVPRNDLDITDPIWTSTYVTRNHGYLVYDTLYGVDEANRAQPQMVEGHAVEDDGKLWTLTLREGLMFHDGQPVLARDCIASIRRWGMRDAFGSYLIAQTAELTAPTDKMIRFRLHRPFAMLPEALGKASSFMPCIMPERLALTPHDKPVREVVGSGPFMFQADERVPGARNVYARFAGYRPRSNGSASFTAGPKIAQLDRVEWITMPDPASAANALMMGEVDWFERPPGDLVPLLRSNRSVAVDVRDAMGQIAIMRLNHLHPPFDNPAIRRVVLHAVAQSEFMQTMIGDDPEFWRDGIGFFAPGSMASGSIRLASRDIEQSRRALEEAGYGGETVVVIQHAAAPLDGVSEVAADLLRRIGFRVDTMLMDNAAMNQRRVKREAPTKGGWSVFFTTFGGLDQINPAGHLALRGNADAAFAGWPTSPKIEQLREKWMVAADIEIQKSLCAEIERQAMQDVPYIPLGQSLDPTAYRKNITGIPKGFCLFWNVDKA